MKKILLATVAALQLGFVAIPAPAAIVINEIESDTFNTPSTDYAEFIELYSTTGSTTSLAGMTLVLFNGGGATKVSYAAIDLDAFSTDASGYFVFGTTSVPQANNTTFLNAGNFLQNGADAVAIFNGDATSYPNGTLASAANLVDAVVYGTDDADDALLLSSLGETVQFNEGPNPASDAANRTLSRFPNGTGELVLATPTPGAVNVPEPTSLVLAAAACGLLITRRRRSNARSR